MDAMVNVNKSSLALLLYDFIYMAENVHPSQVVKNTISCPKTDHVVIPHSFYEISYSARV